MQSIKLSIIVPIYNVEPYLRKCVESLLTQDLSPAEYEIILVDDGSTDGCPAICDEDWCKKNQIKNPQKWYHKIFLKWLRWSNKYAESKLIRGMDKVYKWCVNH